MNQRLEGSGTSEQRRVSYTSLDSQTMAAARAAAEAAGLTLEEWLSRTILENARRSGIIPGQGAGSPPGLGSEQSVNAITRHLRSAQAAADAAGISVAEWLSRTILDNTRRSMAGHVPAPEPGHRAAAPAAENQPPQDPAPAPDAPPAQAAAAETPPPATAPDRAQDDSRDYEQGGGRDHDPNSGQGKGELVEERFAQVVATWRRQLEEAEIEAERERAAAGVQDRRGTLMLTENAPDEKRRRVGVPWLTGTGIVVFGLIAAMIWALPHLPKPRSADDDTATGAVSNGAATRPAPLPRANRNLPPPTKNLDRVRADEMPLPPSDHVAWYQKASDAGNAEAQYVLASLYLQGNGVEQSFEKAAELFQRAADDGKLAKAQYALGVLHARGKGVPKNDVEAVLLYRRAADQGYVPAITQVGLAFLHGRGVKQDLARARIFLERAAEAGEVNAQYTLGRIHQRGMGVPKDPVVALKWFILAAEQKHRLAAQQVEDISIGMKREQQDRATEMAREHNRRFPVKK